jgi:hypothetical protein
MSSQNNPRDERHQARLMAEIERRLRALETAPRAGNTSVASGRLASTNFSQGVSGWGFDGNGHAEFNDLLVTGGSLIVQETGQGLFVYDGPPTLGNLIVSIASAAGTDDFGNMYPKGIDVAEGTIAGSQITIEPGPDNGIFVYGTVPTLTTFTSGSGTWVCPAGVTSVKVECWGGGGAGSDHTSADGDGGGGGGGEYAAEPAYAVTPGNSYAYTVGAGGTTVANGDGNDGASTSFDGTNVLAYGGGGAAVGGFPGSNGTGSGNTVHHDGGFGGFAAFSGAGAGGGGGSGGYTAAGNDGGNGVSANSPGAGASAVAGGGAGGNGGTTTKAGLAGGAPGGGGGGAGSQGTPARGGDGRISITFTPPRTLLASIAGAAGTDPYGNAYPAGISGSKLTLAGVDVSGAWTSYTPAWTSSGTNPTMGATTLNGRYMLIGKTCLVSITITVGSGFAAGTGTYLFSLPFASANAGVNYLGTARLSAASVWIGQVTLGANSSVMNATFPSNSTTTTAANMGAAAPVAPASGNALTMSLAYQIA